MLALLGCQPSGTLVTAAEGGTVTSADGALTILFAPGALPEDARVSIERLAEADWPVDAPGRFERVGEVYAVEPAGVTLQEDAYLVQRFESRPAALRAAEGEGLAVHYLVTADGTVRPAPATRTITMADGRVAVVATLFELGQAHWTGERVPGADRALVQLATRIEAPAGARGLEAPWRWSAGALHVDAPLTTVGHDLRVSAAGVAPAVAPVLEEAEAWRWDATRDAELGLHPWEAFAAGPAERTEAIALRSDRTPAELSPDAPHPLASPLPGWTCEAAGEATLFAGVDVVTGASSGTVRVGAVREIGVARCE